MSSILTVSTMSNQSYWKQWYSIPENAAKHKAAVHERTKRVVKENRERLFHYLLEHPCVDCGEPDPVVLDLDHVTDDKIANVTKLVSRSWDGMMREIEKCEVRCANCHRRKTAERANSIRHNLSKGF